MSGTAGGKKQVSGGDVATLTSEPFTLEITCIRVPEALRGVPLPLEIVSHQGVARQAIWRLDEGKSMKQTVGGPGRYLVRLELPSGNWVAETAIVPTPEKGEDGAQGTVTLNFGDEQTGDEQTALPALEAATTLRNLSTARHLPRRIRPSELFSGAFVGGDSEELYGAFDASDEAEGAAIAAAPGAVGLDYGFFVRWEGDRLVIKRVGSSRVDLPSTIQFTEWHPGLNSHEPKPLLVWAHLPAAKGAQAVEAIVVWPPTPSNSLRVLPDPKGGPNPEAPPLLAFAESGDKTADALFAYILGGRLDRARQVAAPLNLNERAEDLVQTKERNPVAAIVGAYTLLRIGGTRREAWLWNLATWFPHLVDGTIILCWHLIRTGHAPEARQRLIDALSYGLPMFSEGVRLLREGLNFLSGLYPEDAELQAAASRAYRIAAAANLDSELTALRLGTELAVRLA